MMYDVRCMIYDFFHSIKKMCGINRVHAVFLYFAIREYRNAFPESTNNYVSGVAMGMYASFIGVFLFTISMLLFLALDHSFFHQLKMAAPFPEYFTPLSASIIIFTEGIVVSLIGAYLIVRVIDARFRLA